MVPEHMTDTELRRALFSAGEEITLPTRVVESLLSAEEAAADETSIEVLEAEVSELLGQLDQAAEQLTVALERVRAAVTAPDPIDALLTDLSTVLDNAIAATDRPPLGAPHQERSASSRTDRPGTPEVAR